MVFKNSSSWVILDWIRGICGLENLILRPIFKEINYLKYSINETTFDQRYKQLEDTLVELYLKNFL